jgi:hypothetical protein
MAKDSDQVDDADDGDEFDETLLKEEELDEVYD